MDGMMARMPVSRLRGWMAASRVDPFPEERIELMLGQLVTMVANALRKPDKPPYTLDDFVPDYAATPEERQHKRTQKLRKQMEMARLTTLLRGD